MAVRWKPPRTRTAVPTLLLIFVISYTWLYSYQLRNFFSYVSRPLWDQPDGPNNILPHYHADGLLPDAKVCALHGWEARSTQPPVWDAVLFTTELDLLEIRWSELDSVVDKFFLLENNMTFTGRPKSQDFSLNSQRFARFKHKLVYGSLAGVIPPAAEPFEVEGNHRNEMTKLLRAHIPPSGDQPLVIFSDTDELPSAHTIQLLKSCHFPTPLHLRMRTYLYSFEWPYGDTSWRAQVHDWSKGLTLLWAWEEEQPCSRRRWLALLFLLPISGRVRNQDAGYSHADRIGGVKRILDRKRIQRVICEGEDIYNMLPEAYTYRDFFALLWLEPSRSMVGIPRFLIENSSRFKFLLPGGCQREGRPDNME
ncbi:glycosyltransferase family 17 protein [Auriculariales sp. MPI-PUGE-AT-0066]|nr:glycosyltransferase family 17 protein [Auriculariales sp. MPI-PUGE-AT-0066]